MKRKTKSTEPTEAITTKVYKFKATGGFDINKKFREIPSCSGDVCGFELPDGRVVQIVIALEVASKDGNSYKYITSEKTMAELGFEGLDYDKLIFEEGEGS